MARPARVVQPTPGNTTSMRSLMSSQQTSGAYVRAAGNSEFRLRHFLTNWDIAKVGDTHWWLPGLAVHWLTPGVQGVHVLRMDQQHDPAQAYLDSVREAERKGWQYIPEQVPAEFLPEGVGPGPYYRTLPCVDPLDHRRSQHHVEVWNIPDEPLEGLPQGWTYDETKYNAWRLWLVQAGHIRPMKPKYRQELMKPYRKEARRILGANLPTDLREMRTAEANQQVDTRAQASVPEAAK